MHPPTVIDHNSGPKIARVACVRALLALSVALGGCVASPQQPPSDVPSEVPSHAVDLPPGCEPIALRAPDGEPIVLSGRWVTSEDATPMTWWLRTEGSCLYGVGTLSVESSELRADSVQNWRGQIGTDFVITGDIALVGPPHPGLGVPRLAEVRVLIEFADDGEVLLREDRVPGVAGPRCVDPAAYCPKPFVLVQGP